MLDITGDYGLIIEKWWFNHRKMVILSSKNGGFIIENHCLNAGLIQFNEMKHLGKGHRISLT